MAAGTPARLTKSEGRRFGLTVGSAFLLLATVLWWRDRPIAMSIMGVIGSALLLGALLVPGSLGPVNRAWMGLADVLSRVTTPLFLGIVYFAVFTPIGMLRRALGHRTLDHEAVDGSLWIVRSEPRRSDLGRQF